MKYTTLGHSDLNVSRLCLGTVFRSGVDESTCLASIDEAASLGCNYLDCANIYRKGFSEKIVGKAVRGRRDQFVISTKVGAQTDGGPAEGGGLSRDAIVKAIEESLKRLATDHVDTYLCHFPDDQTPIEETLRAMDDLVRQGKIRYPACSNFEGWRVCEALNVSQHDGLAAFVCNQIQYGLLSRHPEQEVISFCQRRNVAITVYATTAIGLLSGRYRYGQPPPPNTSWHRGPYNYRVAMTPRIDQLIQALVDIAGRHGNTPTQMAMAWCLKIPGVTSVIIGADTPERVRENWKAIDIQIGDEEMARLDELSSGHEVVIRKDCPQGWQDSETGK